MRGRDITTEMLFRAYTQGWFPMTVDEPNDRVEWFRPHSRCLLPMHGIHISRSLAKTLRRVPFEVTFDRAFETIMHLCRRAEDNWISESFISIYTAAYEEGWGHSCEVWLDGEIVGGCYGVAIGRAFFAESMFHRRTDMSKVALVALVEKLRQDGYTLCDAQFWTPHLGSLGAFEMLDEEYLAMLEDAVLAPDAWRRVSS